jgi:hypothetical protein
MNTPSPTTPIKKPRRRAAFLQKDIERFLRAAQKVGSEFGVRVEPDGAISICRIVPAPTTEAVAPEKRWHL